MAVRVGTCGWSARGGRRRYFEFFDTVELQETFYKLPREATAMRMRADAPPHFDFNLKAWQAITHPPSSPTWRRAGLKIDPAKRDKYGFFRQTEEVLEAWEKTLRIARILRATTVVFQSPPSFRCSRENTDNLEAFFTTIDRHGVLLGWEPRGDWHDNPGKLRGLLEGLDLIHVVDPLRRDPLRITSTLYFRLHGLGGKYVNYRYKYTDNDLASLREKVENFGKLSQRIYVFFNNVHMFDDARRFKGMVG